MAIVSETVVITVTGVNPQTKTYSVLVDTVTGNGQSNPLSIPIVGVNGGNTDQIVATMPSHAGVAPSNTADIAWQATNGNVAVQNPFTVRAYTCPTNLRGWPGSFGTLLGTTNGVNSLVFNQFVQNYPINGFNNQPTNVGPGGGYKLNPMVAVQQTSGGTYASSLTLVGTTTNNSSGNFPGFILDMLPSLVIATAGWYTFYVNYANVSAFAVYIGGGATFASQSANGGNGGANPFPATGPTGGAGYNLAIVSTNTSAVAHPLIVSTQVYFPNPGIYPIEVIYNQYLSCQFSYDNNSYFQITYQGGQQSPASSSQGPGYGPQFLPVSLIAAPPTTAAPTGVLRLTPTGGAAGLKVQGQTDTLSLNIFGVVYTTVPYIPILEGTSGSLRLFDNGGTAFNFGGAVYSGASPDYASAISSGAVNLSGDNTAWQGLIGLGSVGTSPTGYLTLGYSGSPWAFTGIDITNLTITADDIAWFNNTAKSYDLFAPSSSGGGLQFPIQVAYMVKPATPYTSTLTTIMPNNVADGSNDHTITVTLPKPMSPEQQGLFGTGNSINATASASGGVTVTTPTAILNANGWLTGWQMTATIPHSTTNGSFQLSMNVTGTLTYLNGTSFTTGTVTYITGVVATLNTTGVSYITPTNFSFSVSPKTGTSSPYGISGSITLTAVVFATDNGAFHPNNFFYIHSGTKVAIAGTPTVSSPTPVSGGYHTTISQVVTSLYAWGTPLSLGYSATDSLSGLICNYTDTNTYTNNNPNPGGGGGGGCPAVEMWLSNSMQVCDCIVGASVDALCGSAVGDEYLKTLPTTEAAEVMQMSYSTEVCHRFKTENGAEVIVSASTPFPTRESIESLADGHERSEIKIFANEVVAGMHAITNVGNGPEWSLIIEAECVGMRRVARLYCGGRNFAAGAQAGKYIYTHNLLEVK